MAGEPKIVTKLGKADSDRILVRDQDLIEELLGKVTFSQMTFLMLAGHLPNPGETRMIDALLTVLVEHGMNASVITARLTYSTAPESIQGAVAAAILGAGSVHLGSSEWSAKMLWDALPQGMREGDLDTIAASVVKRHMKVNGLRGSAIVSTQKEILALLSCSKLPGKRKSMGDIVNCCSRFPGRRGMNFGASCR